MSINLLTDMKKGYNRRMGKRKVVIVTGASSGIGKIVAEFLQKRGMRVYGISRSISPSENLPFVIRADITDDESVHKAINEVLEKEGAIDALINVAGFGIAGSVEDTSIEEAKLQFETNFFGTVRMVKEVLPVMRKQKSGHIINISSIGGIVGLPFQAFYSASKFAIEGYTEALWHEVKPFGIKVSLIEPGDFKTNFTQNRKKTRGSLIDKAYTERFLRCLSVMEKDEQNGADPKKIALLVNRIINSENPRLRYAVGPFAERLFISLKKFLPENLILFIFEKYYKL